MKTKLFLLLSICFLLKLNSQDLNCSLINNNLKILNDTSLNLMFQKISSSKILLFGEYHGRKHSDIYPKLISKALSKGYNTVIIELPVSYTLLFEELLEADKFNKFTASLIARVVYNKKDFLKTLKAIYLINKTYPIKVICPDLEHSLIVAKDRLYDILSIHKATLDDSFSSLYNKLKIITDKLVISEGECATLFKEIIDSDNNGKYNNEACLKQDYYLFKKIIDAVKLNGKITGKNYKNDERELYMTNIMLDYYRLDTNMKAIGFFGSVHTQLNEDTLNNKYAPRYPFAKMLNSTMPFKDKVSTVFINYNSDKENSKYYNKYFFEDYVNCIEKKIINSKKQFLFFNDKRNGMNNKINKYSFIMFI